MITPETIQRVLRLKSEEELRRGIVIMGSHRLPQEELDKELNRRRRQREYAAKQRDRGEY